MADAGAAVAEGALAAGEEAPDRLLWVAVDPETGDVAKLPELAAGRLESGYLRGARDVPQELLGGVVHLHGRGPDVHLHTDRGDGKADRDILRLLLRGGASHVEAHVESVEGHWRAASLEAGELRRLELEPPLAEALPAARDGRVVWLSLDPRGDAPRLCPYPRAAAQRLEAAWRAGQAEVDLGETFMDGFFVQLDGEQPLQRTRGGRGRRDACRAPVLDGVVSLDVEMTRFGWKLGPGQTATLRVGTDLAAADVLAAGEAGAEAEAAVPEAAAAEEVSTAVPAGHAPLWQWCQRVGVSPSGSAALPAAAWGVYSREQNEAIERAFAAGERSAKIAVGVREFSITFQGPSAYGVFANQEDQHLHKRRLVRRVLLAEEEREAALRPAAPVHHRDEAACAICAEDFAESSAMPTTELPGCQHVFHTACLLPLADRDEPCPFCRAEIDWRAIFRR